MPYFKDEIVECFCIIDIITKRTSAVFFEEVIWIGVGWKDDKFWENRPSDKYINSACSGFFTCAVAIIKDVNIFVYLERSLVCSSVSAVPKLATTFVNP